MTKNIKLLAALIVAGLFLTTAFRTEAYPPYVRKAEKFGAKDCLFCHTEPQGGEGWNERGKWLMAERDKRKADSIDLEWLAEFKPAEASATPTAGENKVGETTSKEGEAKEGEKKSEETKPATDSTAEKDKDKEKNKDEKDKDKDKTKKKNNGNN
jgi:hypothetical protein